MLYIYNRAYSIIDTVQGYHIACIINLIHIHVYNEYPVYICFPVTTIDVRSVLGHIAQLPCNIEPSTKDDKVYMVLWFRETSVKPIYRFVFLSLSISRHLICIIHFWRLLSCCDGEI